MLKHEQRIDDGCRRALAFAGGQEDLKCPWSVDVSPEVQMESCFVAASWLAVEDKREIEDGIQKGPSLPSLAIV